MSGLFRPRRSPFGRSIRAGISTFVRVITSVVVGVAAAIAMAAPAMADEDDPTSRLTTVLDNIRTWIVGIAGVLVGVMLTVAGVRYLMAGGDPGETEKAKTALRASAVGFAIVILAPVLVEILKGILGEE